MPMVLRSRPVALLALAMLSSACSTTGAPAPARSLAAAPQAAAVENCPRVSLREGTGRMSRAVGQGRVDASITETRSECTVADGQMTVRISVRGRVQPQGGAAGDDVALPIRVAAISGERVLYSELGQQAVQISSSGSGEFSYADTGLRVPVAEAASVQIYAGFDEMS